MIESRKEIINKRLEILKYLKKEKIPISAKVFVEKWIKELEQNPVFDEDLKDVSNQHG